MSFVLSYIYDLLYCSISSHQATFFQSFFSAKRTSNDQILDLLQSLLNGQL